MVNGVMANAFHSASDKVHKATRNWNPVLASADAEWLYERNDAAARIHDLARNNGWMSGLVTKQVDQAIGATFRFVPQPDWEALGLDFDWATDFSRKVQTRFRTYANDPRNLIDAAQRMNLAGLLGQLFRHEFLDGECLAIGRWLTHAPRPYATAIQVIDPDRLSNPNNRMDEEFLRGGVKLDAFGAPMSYHIRDSHPLDVPSSRAKSYTWTEVSKYVPGLPRQQVIHYFDPSRTRAGQTRGKSALVPVVKLLKQNAMYSEYELQAALLNSMFAMVLKSEYDHGLLMQALQTDSVNGHLGAYQAMRQQFHEDGHVSADGVTALTLFPGEEAEFLRPEHPNSQFAAFTGANLREFATAVGWSYEQATGDFSRTNYSSYRGASLEAWKSLVARRGHFAAGVATPIFALWLEEELDRDPDLLPPDAPDFWDMPAAYTRGQWIGPGRGYVDPDKEAKAVGTRLDNLQTTYTQESADQGQDFEEQIDRRAYEEALLAKRGLSRGAASTPSGQTEEESDARDAREDQDSNTQTDAEALALAT